MDGPRSITRGGGLLLRAPAVQAGVIQLSSFVLMLALAYGTSSLTEMQLTIAVAALLQGGIAAAISYLSRLAPWWLFIQAVFPIALVTTLSLHLPPGIFLGVFAILVAVYWSAFRTQVPFYPSGRAVWRAVAAALPADRPVRFVDVGSGFGGLVLHLSAMRKDGAFIGVEVAPLPWFASMLRCWIGRSKARFLRADYSNLDLGAYDVVFAYLSPAAMPALWRKANVEMRSGTLLLSYEFDIPGVKPQIISIPADGGPVLYGWHISSRN